MHLLFVLPAPSRRLVPRNQVNLLSAPMGLCAHLCPRTYDEIVKAFVSASDYLTKCNRVDFFNSRVYL